MVIFPEFSSNCISHYAVGWQGNWLLEEKDNFPLSGREGSTCSKRVRFVPQSKLRAAVQISVNPRASWTSPIPQHRVRPVSFFPFRFTQNARKVLFAFRDSFHRPRRLHFQPARRLHFPPPTKTWKTEGGAEGRRDRATSGGARVRERERERAATLRLLYRRTPCPASHGLECPVTCANNNYLLT